MTPDTGLIEPTTNPNIAAEIILSRPRLYEKLVSSQKLAAGRQTGLPRAKTISGFLN